MKEDLLRDAAQLTPTWVAVLLLLVLVVLAWVNISAQRKWGLLASAVARSRISRQAFREEIDLQDRSLIGLIIMALLVIALFALQASCISAPSYFLLSNYLLYVMASVAILATIIALIRLVSWIFDSGAGLHEYLYHTVLLTIVLGLALLPISLLLAYSGIGNRMLVIIGCTVIALVVSLRWMRAAVIGIGEGIRPQYILLYLCAAEILPAAIAVSSFELSLPQ